MYGRGIRLLLQRVLRAAVLKILDVNVSLDSVSGGGTAERTFQLSRALVRAGMKCTILTLDLGLTPERLVRLEGVRVLPIPVLDRRYFVPKLSLTMIRQVQGSLKDTDLVHLTNHWTFLNALVYLMVRRLGKPYVVCPAGALAIYGRSKLLKRLYNWLVGMRIVRNADGCIAITAGELPDFEAYGIGAKGVSVIPNGINREDFVADDGVEFRKRYRLGNSRVLLFMGRLNDIKGPDLLLRAFCRLGREAEGYHVVFAGPDEGMLPKLRRIAAECHIQDKVHFIGYVGGEAKSQAYHAADLLVVPSRQEAMSIVALEAGASGTPVLLTDRCGFDEVAEVGGGRVVAATVEGLQEGLAGMLRGSEQLPNMGANLQRFVSGRYTWDATAEGYLGLYREILRRRGYTLPLEADI